MFDDIRRYDYEVNCHRKAMANLLENTYIEKIMTKTCRFAYKFTDQNGASFFLIKKSRESRASISTLQVSSDREIKFLSEKLNFKDDNKY